MHVVIVADFAIAEGGAPEVAISSAVGLAASGAKVTYVHGVGEAGDARLENNPQITRVGFGGDDIWSKNILGAVKDGVWNREYIAALSDILGAVDPADTVVHVHQWTKYFSPSVFAVVIKSKLPLAISMHDYFLSCPTGLMYRFDTQDACALKPMSVRCIAARCDPRTHLHKMVRVARGFAVNRAVASNRFAAVHVSETGRETIGAFLPESAAQFVLENPVQVTDTGPRKFSQQNTLVYCGRLTEEKGVLLVAQAAKDAAMPVLFIGEGPSREAIMAANPDAEVTGWLSREEVRQRITAEALAVIAPSRWPETGPLVVAEALAAGIPAIVSDRAGAASRIDHGVNGFVTKPDRDSIVSAIRELHGEGMAQKLGANAYRMYWDNPPSLENHTSELLNIYRQMLQS